MIHQGVRYEEDNYFSHLIESLIDSFFPQKPWLTYKNILEMAKAQNPDVIEIGSSSVEELSRDDESPSKIMMMSSKGTFYFKILNSKYHKTK